MKSWKKRWQKELDAVLPALDEDVINEPIPTRERIELKQSLAQPWYTKLFASPKRIAACLSACAVALVAVGASLYFALQPSAPLTATAEVISVEVNPQAVFSVNKKGKVTAVVAANADADVVLSENRDAEMEGKTVEEAVKIFVDYTAQLGYLDLENSDAVRITSCEANGRLNEVGDALETYFRESGLYIAIAEEIVNLETFCERTNLALQSNVKALKERVERIPALFAERKAEDKEAGDLQTLYRDIVTVEDLAELFSASIEDGVAQVEKRIAALDEIEVKLDEVKDHDDNPGLVFSSYWEIKDDADLSTELTTLIAVVDAKLAAYETAYGVKIESAAEFSFEKIDNMYSSLQVLSGALSDVASNIFKVQFEYISGVLETLGIDTSGISVLYELPQTLEEYMTKIDDYTKACYDHLSEKYHTVYETVREEISEADYERYLAGLTAEYGSLSAYFETL